MGRKKKKTFVDDGRVVANMNVDGMPWYGGPDRNKEAGLPAAEDSAPLDLTPGEKWAMMRGVVGAALLVAAVFIGAFALLILFCIHVWFA